MEATSAFLHSRTFSLGFTQPRKTGFSVSHFNKHLRAYNLTCNNFHNHQRLKLIKLSKKGLICENRFKCSYSKTTTTTGPESEIPFSNFIKSLSLDSVKLYFSQLSPIDFCKLVAALSIVTAATKWTVKFVLNPFVWMYFSWTWMFWPWFVAVALAIYGLYSFRKHQIGEANLIEQLSIVTATFTWLTLVPPGYVNGFLEGWPYVFFLVYHYFFFLNVSVRKRQYGDFYGRSHDPKWDIRVPNWKRLLFCIGIMVGHWFAALEGPELHLIPGGLSKNVSIWIMIIITLFMQYNSTLYLAKYMEKVVVPTAVVQFGPYRWVRHPIYASTMLLFVTYCAALRAPLSSLWIMAVCVVYYEQKAKLEESLMMETFGEKYTEYMTRVKHKFIPFVY